MSVMSFDEIKKLLDKLEKKNKLGNNETMMYFISPFLQSLGYNTFDIDEVDIRNADGEVFAKITDNLSLAVSLYGSTPLETEKNRIFLYVDVQNRVMKLRFRVLNKWEDIVTIDFKKDKSDKYVQKLVKRINKEQAVEAFRSKGEKFLTETVFDSQLERKEWNNDFMLLGLLSELKKPSREFVELMANRMNKDYTTKDVDWIKKFIQPMEKDGLIGLVERMVESGKIAASYSYESTYKDSDESEDYIEDLNKETDNQTSHGIETEEEKDDIQEESAIEKDDIAKLTFGEESEESEIDDEEFKSLNFGEDNEDEVLTFAEDTEDDRENANNQAGPVDLTDIIGG